MKREEAIELLEDVIGFIEDNQGRDYDTAFRMAIEALKQSSDVMELLDDGTLKAKVADVLDIKRIIVMDDNIIYDSYYPDRPKGEWIDNGNNWICSNCGVECYVDEDYRPKDKRPMQMNYCHYCGADMKDGDNK